MSEPRTYTSNEMETAAALTQLPGLFRRQASMQGNTYYRLMPLSFFLCHDLTLF